MDIKRVAFETRPVPSARPARKTGAQPAVMLPASVQPQAPASAGTRISREDVAAIVDRFLSARGTGQSAPPTTPTSAPSAANAPTGNGSTTQTAPPPAPSPAKPVAPVANGGAQSASANGHKPVEFVSEDDVRRAIQKGEKIYVNARTIITPSARDIGEPAEVFAKV
jgi:hypothetical protein